MSLLKVLQRDLTCVQVPWMPTANAATRRLINEIVLEEETDVDPEGQPTSYFEFYVRTMEECGADTAPIHRIVAAVAAGRSISQALDAAQVPDSVRHFVETTFSIIRQGQPHAVAAAFTFGREDLIPAMFRQLVGELHNRFPGQLETFTHYLDRHIQLDEEVHAPLAQQMVRELFADDPDRWLECQQVTIRCLDARLVLWDGIKSGRIRRSLV